MLCARVRGEGRPRPPPARDLDHRLLRQHRSRKREQLRTHRGAYLMAMQQRPQEIGLSTRPIGGHLHRKWSSSTAGCTQACQTQNKKKLKYKGLQEISHADVGSRLAGRGALSPEQRFARCTPRKATQPSRGLAPRRRLRQRMRPAARNDEGSASPGRQSERTPAWARLARPLTQALRACCARTQRCAWLSSRVRVERVPCDGLDERLKPMARARWAVKRHTYNMHGAPSGLMRCKSEHTQQGYGCVEDHPTPPSPQTVQTIDRPNRPNRPTVRTARPTARCFGGPRATCARARAERRTARCAGVMPSNISAGQDGV